MTERLPLLDSTAMARFVARGFLLLEGVVPDAINRAFMASLAPVERRDGETLGQAYGRILAGSDIPEVAAGTPLADAYPPRSPLARLLEVPAVRGAVESLVGPGARFDHHFLHVALPASCWRPGDPPQRAQHLHQDSTIDPRRAFDIQLMYYPHAVTREMGGTRYVPGTHLRIVSEAAVARYQNMAGQRHLVCPAGSLLVVHHGLWHGGGINRTEAPRYMFKIRIGPTVPQRRLWDTSDLGAEHGAQRPIFFLRSAPDPEDLHSILMRPEPWFEMDTGRLELMNRVRLWRRLLGEPEADVDYWLTRVENEPGA